MDARISRKGLGVAIATLAMACTGSGGANGRLPVSARTVTPAGAATTATTAGLDLGNGIVLGRVRLAVQKISLDAAEASAAAATAPAAKEGGDDGGGGSGSGMDDGSGTEEVEVGPFAVDLGADALAGGIHPVFDSDVPAGTYRELRIAIGPVADTTMGTPLGDLGGRSVVVDGTIDGAPFSFASALASAQKVEMTIQVAPDGSSRGVTLTVDPHGWFRAPDGSRLDPTVDANRAAIEDAIRASIGAELEDEAEGSGGGGADDGAGHA
jgi:hypothetical protein